MKSMAIWIEIAKMVGGRSVPPNPLIPGVPQDSHTAASLKQSELNRFSFLLHNALCAFCNALQGIVDLRIQTQALCSVTVFPKD